MKVSKLDQINNTLELNKKSLQNNTKVNTEFIAKSVLQQKTLLDKNWFTHLQTCYTVALNASTDIATMFEGSLDMNSKKHLKKSVDINTRIVREFKKHNKITEDVEDVYLDYVFMMNELINKFTVALYEGKQDQFMDSLQFFKKLNSNGKLI